MLHKHIGLNTSFCLSVFFTLFFSASLFAQHPSNAEPCGFDAVHNHLLQTDSLYRKSVEAEEQRMQQAIANNNRLSGVVYKIPVVVHVIHLGEAVGTGTNISTAQIQSAISNLTSAYRNQAGYTGVDAEIEFYLAGSSPTCSGSSGINRINGSSLTAGGDNYGSVGITSNNEAAVKALSRWPSYDYYNIWIVSEINNNGGGSGTQGYAYYPGANAALDGAVILYNSFGYDPTGAFGYNLKSYTNYNITTIHELGHAFGVYHTFNGDNGGNNCPSNSNCLSDGDFCCDTPPHIRSNSNCNPSGTNACNGGSSNALFVHNFMDYSSDVCQTRFSLDQIQRMRSSSRINLDRSFAVNGSSGGAPSMMGCAIAATNTGTTGSYQLGPQYVELNGMKAASGDAYQDGAVYLDRTCGYGTTLTQGSTYTLFLGGGIGFATRFKAYIDYNNDGNFSDPSERIYDKTGVTEVPSGMAFTVPTTGIMLNLDLRLRVVGDFGAPSPCTTPTYGQVEDYNVRISAALPVELVDFSATLVGDAVRLNWQTASEKDNALWEIERSENGYQFDKIADQKAENGLENGATYTEWDRKPTDGINYYRLKQHDISGKTSFSKVVIVRTENKNQWSISPNPVQNHFFIQASDGKSNCSIRLIGTDGRVQRAMENVQPGTEIWIDDLPKGIYFLQITTWNGARETLRVLRN